MSRRARSGRRATRALAALLLLLAAGAARGDAADCADCRYTGELARLFVEARALGPGWETLAEAPSDPLADADLRDAGVRATHSLHYTHELRAGAEVCSVEIWGFASPAEARRAHAEMERPGWRFGLHGNLIVMVRGASLRRDSHRRPGLLLPACHRLGDLVEARVQETLRALPPNAPER